MGFSFDFDGVYSTGKFNAKAGDVIVTGRCHDESSIVYSKLDKLGAKNIPVYFNTMTLRTRGDFTEDARKRSAIHKCNILKLLHAHGDITHHYEDDPIQLELIKLYIPTLQLVFVENKTGDFYGNSLSK